MRKALVAVPVLLLALAAPSVAHAQPPQNSSNCAGVFASSALTPEAVTFLARSFTGVSEFVLVDANCGRTRP